MSGTMCTLKPASVVNLALARARKRRGRPGSLVVREAQLAARVAWDLRALARLVRELRRLVAVGPA